MADQIVLNNNGDFTFNVMALYYAEDVEQFDDKSSVLQVDVENTFDDDPEGFALGCGGELPVSGAHRSKPNIYRCLDAAQLVGATVYAMHDIHNRYHCSNTESFVGFGPFTPVTLSQVRQWIADGVNPLDPNVTWTLSQLEQYLILIGSVRSLAMQMAWVKEHAIAGTPQTDTVEEIQSHSYTSSDNYVDIEKGNEIDPVTGMEGEAYSALFYQHGMPTRLFYILLARHIVSGMGIIGQVFVNGWAGNVCAGYTALDAALRLKLPTWFIADAQASVPLDIYDPANRDTYDATWLAELEGLGLRLDQVITLENEMVARLINAKVRWTTSEKLLNAAKRTLRRAA